MSTYHMKSSVVLVAAMWLVNPSHAIALVIDPVFGASIIGDAINGAAIMADVRTAINFYETTFTAPITAKISFEEGPGSFGQGLGANSFSSVYTSDYNTVFQPALVAADANSSIGRTAISNLPSEPAGTLIAFTSAEGRSLGLNTPGQLSGQLDGGVTLGTGNQYVLPPPGGPLNPNAIYGLSLIQHEINEVLGIGGNSLKPSGSVLGPMNLFSFKDSAGNFFFSIDGGHTLLQRFIGPNTAGADPADWAAGTVAGGGACPTQSNQVQGGTCFGQLQSLDASSAEVVALTALGFDNTQATGAPEPSTFLLIASGLGGVLLNKKRNQKRV